MRFSVTTPVGAVVEADIDEVTAPGQEGEFGVLPEHIPLMAALKPGVLTYRTSGGGRSHVLAVGEGFLQVAPVAGTKGSGDAKPDARPVDRVLVLVDRAVAASGIDRAAAARDLARAETEIAAWKQELDGAYAALLVRRDWALAQVNASERPASAN
jgi:F-type H+-transporting ATPase subunit epsilon